MFIQLFTEALRALRKHAWKWKALRVAAPSKHCEHRSEFGEGKIYIYFRFYDVNLGIFIFYLFPELRLDTTPTYTVREVFARNSHLIH